jgi:hypothetical protein
MDQDTKTKIYFNKSRIAVLLFVSVIFIALGAWFIVDALGTNAQLGNPIIKVITGAASILFFGLLAFHFSKKVFNSLPALIISEEGIVDNSSGTCAGFVPWTDINGIKETKIGNRMFINIVVKDPGLYIDRQESGFKKRIMRMNYNANGTAIGITARGLQCTHNQLKHLLDAKFAAFKKNNSPASRS